MKEKKKILVCPLDWGLGHATRCVPVIRELLRRDCDVRIASSGAVLSLLKKEFPALVMYNLTGYRPFYSEGASLLTAVARQLPKFSRAIKNEHTEVDSLIRREEIDLVISDNRFGCWTSLVPCVMITHQINIRVPIMLSWVVNAINHRHIKKFSTCWIPDEEGDHSLSGALSASPPFSVEYVGNLSRFHKLEGIVKKYKILALVSGPEPQRTIFETMMRKELKASGLTALLVRGLPESIDRKKDGNLEEVTHLSSEELNRVMQESEIVVSRPGYSTLMDMAKLGARGIFIPTPGQTEQEYLGAELMKHKIAFNISQEEFNLGEALKACRDYTGFGPFHNSHLLEAAIGKLKL